MKDFWSILDLVCLLISGAVQVHAPRGLVHQSSMSSYTISSQGSDKDGCILRLEYLSWRRSPTSLMTLSACGDIYTIKRNLSPWRAICDWRKFKVASRSSKMFHGKTHLSCKIKSQILPKQKTPPTSKLQMDPVCPIFHSPYLGAIWSHQ